MRDAAARLTALAEENERLRKLGKALLDAGHGMTDGCGCCSCTSFEGMDEYKAFSTALSEVPR
jgi:hypothetical protein